ncbi:hypothetical protein ACGF7U_31280 [Micromonospora sp. NPDC047670]|uniref:hypothetical protein n=1 Tax=Micromonospora sp. NPDC047670 TaxID=3364252 RepID=UPI0037130B03
MTATLAAVLLAAICAVLLAWIVLLLRTDRHDHVVRVVAVVHRPAPPATPAGTGRPLVNPRFAAHIAARSAEFAAATRAGRHVVAVAVDAGRGSTAAAAGRDLP